MITEIGKIKIKWDTSSSPKQMRSRLLNHYKNFLITHPHDVDIKITVRMKNVKLPVHTASVLYSRSWEYFKYDGRSFFRFSSGDLAEVGEGFRKIKVYIQNKSGQLLFYLFPEILYSFILPEFDGILLHACGVKMGNRIFVFLAPSEGGKSTIAKLALKKGLILLNDDRIIVRKIRNKFYAFGNPWHGEVEHTSSEWGEVKELFFLKKARRNFVKEVDKKRMFAEMLNNSFYVKVDRENFRKVIEVIGNIVNNVKGYELSFRPDENIWGYLDERFR